jgi:hypothetical protein
MGAASGSSSNETNFQNLNQYYYAESMVSEYDPTLDLSYAIHARKRLEGRRKVARAIHMPPATMPITDLCVPGPQV